MSDNNKQWEENLKRRIENLSIRLERGKARRYVIFMEIPGEEPYKVVPGEAYTNPGDEVRFFNLLGFDVDLFFIKESPFDGLPPKEKITVRTGEEGISVPFKVIEYSGPDIKHFHYVAHETNNPENRIFAFSDPDILIDP